jgi:hypothetical protein
VVNLSGTPTANFNNKHVGTNKPVTLSGLSLTGVDAINYTLSMPALQADITPATLIVNSPVAQNKVYDGTTAATITWASISTIFGSDDVTVWGNGTFSDKNVGTGKAVTANLTLSGADAGNYNLTQPTGLTADITPKPLNIIGLTAQSKIFDGNTNVTLVGTPALSGVVSGDNVSLSGTPTGAFNDPNIGTNKPVSVTGLSIVGPDVGNYTLNPLTLLASIFPAVPPAPIPPPPSPLNPNTLPVLSDRVFNPAGEIINPQMLLQNGQQAQAAISGPIVPVFERGQFRGYRITGAGTVCFTFYGQSGTNSQAQVCFRVLPAPCGEISFNPLVDVKWNTTGQPLVASAPCGRVSFRTVSGTADVVGNTVRPFPRRAGIATIEAFVAPLSLDVNRDGVADFVVPAPVQRSFRILPVEQTITFLPLPVPRADVGVRLPLIAYASSGLPVELVIVQGSARVEGRELVITGAGNIVIEARQAGNEAWLSAEPVRRSIEGVEPIEEIVRRRRPQTISFELPSSNLQNGFALSATATSNLPVSYAVVEGGNFVRIVGNQVVISARPSRVVQIVIEASQAGNEEWLPAEPVRRSFLLLPQGAQTVLLTTGALCRGSSIRARTNFEAGENAFLRLVLSDNQGNFNGGEGTLDAVLENNNTLVSVATYAKYQLPLGVYRVRIDVVTPEGTIIGEPSVERFQLVEANQPLSIAEGISPTGIRTLRSSVSNGNVWRRDGAVVGNTQEIEATVAGWYELTAQAGNCTFVAITYISNNGRVEAKESAGRMGWRVYPNPSKGLYRLQGRQGVEGEMEVIISDLQGRVISRQWIVGKQVDEQIDIGQLSTGVYVLQIRQSDGRIWTEKLVKE